MRVIKRTNAFKKDYKRAVKRNKKIKKLVAILELLIQDKPLLLSTRPHQLIGEYSGFWECHIEPDWLLIYELSENELILRRMGSHADLFR